MVGLVRKWEIKKPDVFRLATNIHKKIVEFTFLICIVSFKGTEILEIMNIRIPYNEEFTNKLGLALYVFAYYEGTIIDILSFIDHEFRLEYYRKSSLTSGQLKNRFENYLSDNLEIVGLLECYENFKNSIDLRNSLIHAHPATDSDGEIILNYQTKFKKVIHDYKWTFSEIDNFINTINDYEILAAKVLDEIRK